MPKIPEDAKCPFIVELTEIIEQQSGAIQQQAEMMQMLRLHASRPKSATPTCNPAN